MNDVRLAKQIMDGTVGDDVRTSLQMLSDQQIREQSLTASTMKNALPQFEIELQLLRQLGTICAEASSEDELLQRSTKLIAETLFPDNCGFLLLEADRSVLITHPSFVVSDPTVSLAEKALGVGITGEVAQTGHARRVGDVRLEPGYLAADLSTRSEMCLPMKIGQKVVGVLNVESRKRNAFSDHDERLASTVVDLVGNALARLRLERAARESEQRFALFMQHLPGLAWIKDDCGRYVFVNATAERAFGIPLSQLFGKTDDEIFPPETAAQFKENDSRALTSRTEVRTIELLKDQDGLIHHSIVSKFSLPSSNGNSQHVAGIAFDITEQKQAEETLRRTSAFREAIVRMAGEGICVCHAIPEFPYVTFLVWNERMTELTGYTIEEINRLGWYQTMYPDLELQQHAINRMSEMREGHDMRAEEWEITRKEGTRRTVAISTSIVEMDENAVCVMAVMHDVTERKKADQKLRMMQFSVDHSSDAIAWVAPDARILYANAATSQRLGYSIDELLQKSVYDFDPDFPAVAWPAHWEELKQRRSMVFESRHQTKDGQIIWVEINANYVNFDGQEFNFASSRDITERKQAEVTLRENETRFRLLFDGANDAIFWADATTGLLTHCNSAAESLLGRERAEIIGQPQYFLHPAEEIDRYRAMFQAHATAQSKSPIEVEVVRKDGRRVDVSISPSITEIAGQRVIQGIFRDITERKRIEAELSLRQCDLLHASRLNAIGQMVAGLSHEVAQPLSAISNFALASTRLLESGISDKIENLKEYIQAITDQSRRCAAIIRRLRDFSRRAPTLKTPCDLNQLLQESVDLIASEIRRYHAQVRLVLTANMPPVSADRVQIQQVMINLVNNALDAVRHQKQERRLVTIRTLGENGFAVIEVEDCGSGIASEIVPQLFEPFFTTKDEGLGLGLNICETIVRDHGGKIVVTTNEFAGATFRVRLPFQSHDEMTS